MMCYYRGVNRIGIRELRQHASRYVARARAGETFEVTDRGVLVALLTPPRPLGPREQLIAAGRLRPAVRPTGRLGASNPVLVGPGEPSNADVLELERDDRL